jgi:hypothetical protein
MIDKIHTRYYTNRERRRYHKKAKSVKMMAVNEILKPKTPVGLRDVFNMLLGRARV